MHFFVLKAKSLKFGFIVLLCTIMLCLSFNSSYSLASVFFGSALREIPIYNVQTDKKEVAISFDAAWGADKTAGIVSLLKQHNARATFFLVGFWAEDYPDMVKMIDQSNMEIGTHSNTHPDFTKLSVEQMRNELQTSMDIIKNITNKGVKLFRPPYGAYNDNVINTAKDLGLTTIQWDVDSLDWKGISATEITTRILNKVKNGSIILCHNNSDHIVEALPMILERLALQGYSIKAVGDIILQDNYYIDHAGMQIAK